MDVNSRTASDGAEIEKFPSMSVLVPVIVPWTRIAANDTGSPFDESVTFPETVLS